MSACAHHLHPKTCAYNAEGNRFRLPVYDQSATIAGVLTSASASQSAGSPCLSTDEAGGALAGLIAGAFVPTVMGKVSSICHQHHVTATMTNILCGGGAGMLVGLLMHLSGIAHGLGLVTRIVRSLLRWKRLILPSSSDVSFEWSLATIPLLLPHGIKRFLFPTIHFLQEQYSAIVLQSPTVLYKWSFFLAFDRPCSQNYLPIPIGFGFLYGCIFVFGSKIGWYHSMFLPAILLEMDSASKGEEASLFGAIDQCTLVMICAGICSANLLNYVGDNAKSGGGHASLSYQAQKTNLCFGDFIEAAYPSMERSRMINTFAYLAAGLSTEIIFQRHVLSSAYFPLPLAIWISNDRWGMFVACFVAFVVSFIGTLLSNAIASKVKKEHQL